MSQRFLRFGLPIVVFALVVLCWDLLVRAFAIPPYVLPSPGLVLATLISDAGLLWRSLVVTLTLTFEGFLLAAVGGILLAIAFNQWRLVEYSFYPYAVILQVTPIVAIAPLLLIYLPQPLAVLVCAWIVAFFPVLANTTLGIEFRRPQSSRALRALQSVPLAGPLESETAISPAANACRPAHRRRPVAHRGGCGRNCRGFGRRWFRTRLSYCQIRLSTQYPAHVRGFAFAVLRRCRDFLHAIGDFTSCAAPLARERDRSRALGSKNKLHENAKRGHRDHHLDETAVQAECQYGRDGGQCGRAEDQERADRMHTSATDPHASR